MRGDKLLDIVRAVEFDTPFRLVLPNGAEASHGAGAPAFVIKVKTWRAVSEVIARSSIGFGEAYVRGEIEVEGDLRPLVLLSFAVRETLLKGGLVERARYMGEVLARRNSPVGSRRNIAAHYDLDNDFYALWLDEAMQYTCAYFERPDETLESAQRRKMELVCRKLDLKPGDAVVEAGCGWGGLALHMVQNHDVRVKAFNISAAQVEFARARAEAAGVGPDRLEYVLDDYRNIPRHVTKCDKFASICMLEHVGRENYGRFFSLVQTVLEPTGLAMLQVISRMRPAATANPWLEKHVFPGYYNPSLGELLAGLEARSGRLHLIDAENMRFHYALTLEHWLARLEANAETIRERWGERVLRTFRLYLAGGLADFGAGAGTLLYQLLLRNGTDNAAPLARRYLMDATPARRARALQPA